MISVMLDRNETVEKYLPRPAFNREGLGPLSHVNAIYGIATERVYVETEL